MRLALVSTILLLLCQLGLAQDGSLKKGLDHLESTVLPAMKLAGTPGLAIAVVKGSEIVYLRGFGVRQVDMTASVTPKTIFQIGSISKSFTALLVAKLVDDKILNWNERVIDHLADFRLFDSWVNREFRIFDLMSHHSGLPATAGDLQHFFNVDRDHMIKALRLIEPTSSFRTEFAYQNGLFLVAAKLLESKRGRSWETLVRETIFQSLGMKDSTTSFPSYLQAANRASFHQEQNGKVVALPDNWPYLGYVDLLGPAGGINSNAQDMAKYLRFRMNESESSILSSESAKFLRRPQTIIGTSLYYCQAWIYHQRPSGAVIWHNGETSGAKNMLAFNPQSQIGIVILSNLRATKLPEWIAFSFLDAYHGQTPATYKVALHKTSKPSRPKTPQPTRPLPNYIGHYYSAVYGQVEVLLSGDSLSVRLGEDHALQALQAWSGDKFWLELPVVDAPANGFAQFEFGDDDKVKALLLEAFDDGGIGLFKKILSPE